MNTVIKKMLEIENNIKKLLEEGAQEVKRIDEGEWNRGKEIKLERIKKRKKIKRNLKVKREHQKYQKVSK